MNETAVREKQLELYSKIPPAVRGGLVHAIVYGYPPGGFVSAVLANDLSEAIGRADTGSQNGLAAIVTWVYSFAPRGCCGSPKNLEVWGAERVEALPHCQGLIKGLEIFSELGDSVAADALVAIASGSLE